MHLCSDSATFRRMITLCLAALVSSIGVHTFSPAPARAPLVWDATGHRTIAALTYARLREGTRAQVDQLMRAHPDLDSLAVGVDPATADGVRELFLRASVWPDRIRRDPRFFEATVAEPVPTPSLPGFPDMVRHSDWHYLSRAFATDGTPAVALPEPSTPTHVGHVMHALGNSDAPAAARAYHLSWVVHVVGDLHQPLHGTSRATRTRPAGDAGGNGERVRPDIATDDSTSLHAFWDGAFTRGVGHSDAVRAALALDAPISWSFASADPSLSAVHEAPGQLLRAWADESETLARHLAYAYRARAEGDLPPRLDAAYLTTAARVARERVILASDRLVAVLEALLGT